MKVRFIKKNKFNLLRKKVINQEKIVEERTFIYQENVLINQENNGEETKNTSWRV